MSNSVNPLSSLIRASAWDAGNASMRASGRSAWSREDFNAAAETQQRLVLACYGKPGERDEYPWASIRFGIAERAEREGKFTLTSDFKAILAAIDDGLASADQQAA